MVTFQHPRIDPGYWRLAGYINPSTCGANTGALHLAIMPSENLRLASSCNCETKRPYVTLGFQLPAISLPSEEGLEPLGVNEELYNYNLS